jgi:hypothetical protein
MRLYVSLQNSARLALQRLELHLAICATPVWSALDPASSNGNDDKRWVFNGHIFYE